MRDCSPLFLLFSFLVSFASLENVGLSTESSTQTTLIGNHLFSSYTASLQFEEEMFVGEDLFCSSKNYEPRFLECIPCNYSGASEGGLCVDEFLNVDPLSLQIENNTLPNCTCDPTLCFGTRIVPGETKRGITSTENRLASFRYEHTDFETGFVVRIFPIDSGSFSFYVSIDEDLSQTTSLGSLVGPLDTLLICPSHPLFGPSSPTITYHIFVVSEISDSSFDLSVDFIPSLLPSEEEDAIPISVQTGVFVLGNAPYLLSSSLLPANNETQSASSFLLFPINECTTVSIKTEILAISEVSSLENSVRIQFGFVSGTDLASLLLQQDLTRLPIITFLQSKLFSVQTETVVTTCPGAGGLDLSEPIFLAFVVQVPILVDGWTFLAHLRNFEQSPYRQDLRLSDLSTYHFQSKYWDTLTLSCSCFDSEDCETFPYPNLLELDSRFNRMTPSHFHELLFSPPDAEIFPDLALEFSNPEGGTAYFRCLNPRADSACGIMRVIPQTEYINPRVYPMPEIASLMEALPYQYSPDLLWDLETRSDAINFFLQISFDDLIFFSEERLETCSLAFVSPTPFHSADLRPPVYDDFQFRDMNEKDTKCEPESWNPVANILEVINDEFDAYVGNGSLNEFLERSIQNSAYSYASISLSLTEEWQRCFAFAESLTTIFYENVVHEDTEFCYEYDPDDPCCNIPEQWQTCCQKRDILQENVTGRLTFNETAVNDQCDNPDCAANFVVDFGHIYNNAYTERICSWETNSDPAAVVLECQHKWLGIFPDGMYCGSNEDCTNLYGPDSSCDFFAHQCLVNWVVAEDLFLQCVYDSVGPFTRTFLFRLIEGNFTGAQLLRMLTTIGPQCVSDYGPMTPERTKYSLETLEQSTCPLCANGEIECLTNFCTIPTQCVESSLQCSPNLNLVNECHPPTEDDLICNWDSSLNSSECETGEEKCMYCYNSSNCVVFPEGDQTNCEETPICLLNDGTLLWNVTEEECSEIGSCSFDDEDKTPPSNKTECEASGFCEDPDLILTSLELIVEEYPTLTNVTQGVCISPLSPFNQPSCTERRGGAPFTLDFASRRGCVVFSLCTAISLKVSFPVQCVFYPANPEECENDFNGTWLVLPFEDEEDCENPRGVSSEDFPGFCNLQDEEGALLAPISAPECETCDGEPTPPAQWVKSQWDFGIPTFPQWKTAEMVPTYYFVENSINFVSFSESIRFSELTINSLNNINIFQCSLYPFKLSFDYLACDCNEDDNFTEFGDVGGDVELECSSGSGLGVSLLTYCPNETDTVGVTSGRVTSLRDSVIVPECFFSYVGVASDTAFVGNREKRELTVFGDPNDIDPFPVRNQKGASVGRVLESGVFFETIDENFTITTQVTKVSLELAVYFVLKGDELKGVSNMVIDFGIEVTNASEKAFRNEIELRPLNAQGPTMGLRIGDLLDQELFYATGIYLFPFLAENGTRIFPIARLENWETEKTETLLTTGERGMMGCFCGFYGLTAILIVYWLFLLMNSDPSLSNLLLYFFSFLLMLFRTLLTGLFASGHFTSASNGYYVLLEPPSFFYLSVLTILIMSYSYAIATLREDIDVGMGHYWLIWFCFQIFLYIVMVVVIVLLTTLPTSSTITINCFGRNVEVEENETVEIIRISYHSFILVVALICAFFVFSLGRKLRKEIRSRDQELLSIIGGVGLLCTNLMWVIYSGVKGSSPFFVIPLFLTESFPICSVCYLCFPKHGNLISSARDSRRTDDDSHSRDHSNL